MPITIPAGTYALGDPCYSIRGNDWSKFIHNGQIAKESAFNEYEQIMEGAKLPAFAFQTAYGDGSYGGTGFDGLLDVDSGLIGLVEYGTYNTEEAVKNKMAVIVQFKSDVTATNSEDGIITIGHVEVITGDEDEEWGYDDDDEE